MVPHAHRAEACPRARQRLPSWQSAWLRRFVASLGACCIAVALANCSGGDSAGPPPRGGGFYPDASVDQSVDAAPAEVGADAPKDSVSEGDAQAVCVPKTCLQLGAKCGSAPDGCGGKVECGTCPSGQLCGGGGVNQCGNNPCTPKTCSQVAASCGYASDMCGSALDCGGCMPPLQCGVNGKLNECGCVPKTCLQVGASCGSVPDGCGATIDCGACPSG